MIKLSLIIICISLSACANIYRANNGSISNYELKQSYRTEYFNQVHQLGDNLIFLAFSGGGTRASALSYGVMQELRDTTFLDHNGVTKTLLSDVDYISSVSGGSFTAAYYAAFGERLFADFEEDFLRQSNEGALLSRFLSPRHWFRSLWTGFDRTEMAIEYYDENIFKGATFGDISLAERPMVLINATDLSRGARFVFDQDNFDWLCADLNTFSLARAVTASSAVPVAFPSVVLKNRSGECDLSQSHLVERFTNLEGDTLKQRDYIEVVDSYLDQEKTPYIHLVDGGISDNLGLRSLSDQLEVYGLKK